jgi:3,4-dihydroxy-2-butanone 4-phosphate synthase/GTP cyclohydrolase II
MTRPAAQPRLRRVASTRLPTEWGTFETLGFERRFLHDRETALALVLGDLKEADAPLVRIHSQCFTGEVLGSLRCDCGEQLELAMRAIAEEGSGVLIYEYQEGRGIGLMAKLQAYSLQDKGLDTVEANHALGLAADYRDFSLATAILNELGITRVRLLSNNPDKSRALSNTGIEVVTRIPCEAVANNHSLAYLRTKKEKMGHTLTLGSGGALDDPGRTRATKSHEQVRNNFVEEQAQQDHEMASEQFEFASIDEAIRELREGRMIVVIDDEDRENEGDLTMAAEMITPETINFMARHGRGLICLAMTDERLQQLQLEPMAPENSALGGTAFTVSIDLIGRGVTTGISAYDRAETIRAAVDPNSCAEDFARPGHVFPLRARPGGVLERRGQTEAAVDLSSLAGLEPAGVICEIVNDDGTMARVPDLISFCKKHGLLMITVADLARYRFDCDYEGALAAIDGIFPVCPRTPSIDMVQDQVMEQPDLVWSA